MSLESLEQHIWWVNIISDVNNEIKVSDLYGIYSWQENFTTDTGVSLTRKIKLTLNSDGTALYEASDGMSAESTKGKFTFENGYITYTSEFNNYPQSKEELKPSFSHHICSI